MTIRRLIYAKFLVLTAMWWGWTILVDIFVIPTVFRTIDIFFKAGDLGIAVFSKLNNLEVFVSSILVALLAYQVTKNKKALPLLIMTIVAWFIAMTYFAFLTPKLTHITELWKTADLMGLTGVAEYPDLQQAHQFYHKLYIGTDVFKLVLLSVMLGYGIWKEEEWR